METLNPENQLTDPAKLVVLRRRRWFLWTLILIYIPGTIVTLKFVSSMEQACIFFAVWFVLLIVATVLLATSRCPRCGNNFHMRNSSLSFLSKCRHCSFHISGAESGNPLPS